MQSLVGLLRGRLRENGCEWQAADAEPQPTPYPPSTGKKARARNPQERGFARGAYGGGSGFSLVGGLKFSEGSVVGVETRPFGPNGPRMRYHKRASGIAFAAARGFWLLCSVSCLSMTGFAPPSTLTHLSWLLLEAVDVIVLLCHLLDSSGHLEHLVLFWTLPMVHGLLWCPRLARARAHASKNHRRTMPPEHAP